MLEVDVDQLHDRVAPFHAEQIPAHGNDAAGRIRRQIETPEELLPRAFDGTLQARQCQWIVRLEIDAGSRGDGRCIGLHFLAEKTEVLALLAVAQRLVDVQDLARDGDAGSLPAARYQRF